MAPVDVKISPSISVMTSRPKLTLAYNRYHFFLNGWATCFSFIQ